LVLRVEEFCKVGTLQLFGGATEKRCRRTVHLVDPAGADGDEGNRVMRGMHQDAEPRVEATLLFIVTLDCDLGVHQLLLQIRDRAKVAPHHQHRAVRRQPVKRIGDWKFCCGRRVFVVQLGGAGGGAFDAGLSQCAVELGYRFDCKQAAHVATFPCRKIGQDTVKGVRQNSQNLGILVDHHRDIRHRRHDIRESLGEYEGDGADIPLRFFSGFHGASDFLEFRIAWRGYVMALLPKSA